MPRIRYLKPDFFKDEHIKDLPYEARLFYQGLWCYADKKGRLEDRPERLKVEIMPYDKIDIEEILNLLSSPKKNSKRPYILRYSENKENYIQILQWNKHQKPHHTEQESIIPEPPKNILEPLNNGCISVVTQEGMEKGMEKIKSKGKDKDKDKEIPPDIEQVISYCQERKNNVDAEAWYNHYTAKGWFIGKTKMVDWKAAVRTWEKNSIKPTGFKKP